MEEGEGKGNYRMVGKEGRNQEEGEGGGGNYVIKWDRAQETTKNMDAMQLCLTYIERRI